MTNQNDFENDFAELEEVENIPFNVQFPSSSGSKFIYESNTMFITGLKNDDNEIYELNIQYCTSIKKGFYFYWTKKDGYVETFGIIPKISKNFDAVDINHVIGSHIDDETKLSITNIIKKNPLYILNLGKLGRSRNILAIQKKGTYRQSTYWVFDNQRLHLTNQLFLFGESTLGISNGNEQEFSAIDEIYQKINKKVKFVDLASKKTITLTFTKKIKCENTWWL